MPLEDSAGESDGPKQTSFSKASATSEHTEVQRFREGR